MNRVGTLSGGSDSKGGLTIFEPQQILDHYVRSAQAGVVPLNKNSSEVSQRHGLSSRLIII
jgi:hypothetical protein